MVVGGVVEVAQVVGEVALRVEVDEQRSVTGGGCQPADVGYQGGLAYAALTVGDADDPTQGAVIDGHIPSVSHYRGALFLDTPTGPAIGRPSGATTALPMGFPEGTPIDLPTVVPLGAPAGPLVGTPITTPDVTTNGAPSGTPPVQPSGTPFVNQLGAPTAAPSGAPVGYPYGGPSVEPYGVLYGAQVSVRVWPQRGTSIAHSLDQTPAACRLCAATSGSVAATINAIRGQQPAGERLNLHS